MSEIIKANEIESKITQEGVTFVEAFQETCGPCKMMAPYLEELSKSSKVLKIDVDKQENKEWVEKQQIFSVPQTFVYKNGKFVDRLEGFAPKEQLEQYL